MSWANDPVRDQARGDALRLLRSVPAITDISYLDSNGIEQLELSRVAPDIATQTDFSHDPKFTDAVAKKAYYGPVYLRRQSEPYLTMSFAGAQREYGVIVVEVGIKLVWDVIQRVGVGQNGAAYIVDAQDWVIAHSNPMLVVREIDSRSIGRSVERKFPDAVRLHEARVERSGAKLAHDSNGRELLTVHAAVGSGELGWMLFAEVPVEEAGTLAQ
jgi:hypothetical protein